MDFVGVNFFEWISKVQNVESSFASMTPSFCELSMRLKGSRKSDGFFIKSRVSVQGVKSLGGHFACLCQGFEIYEVKKNFVIIFQKKMEILLHFLSFL